MAKAPANRAFTFDKFEIDKEANEIRLHYKLLTEHGEDNLVESLLFPKHLAWKRLPPEVLNSAVKNLHILAGVSYWKAYCPRRVEFPHYSLTKGEAKFYQKIYENGLGEFLYRNRISFKNLIKFQHKAKRVPRTLKVANQDKSLLLFGGGKDSLVSAEMLKSAKKKFNYIFISSGPLPEVVRNLLPSDAIVVYRKIDPKISEINRRPGVYNGHIPITAIIASVAEIAALLYGYRYVIASNERSADYGNVRYLGRFVNHQWSKSYEAEKLIQDHFKNFITPSIGFFSLLRPFYEIKIIEIFSRLKKYFPYFSSCNKNFRVFKKRSETYWCGECPKCAFVFSSLSAFIPKEELIKVFGKDLYADPKLKPLFEELLGIRNFKPFECVGTPEEMNFAFMKALGSGRYSGEPAMNLFVGTSQNKKMKFSKQNLFSASKKHLIPKEFEKAIAAFQ